MYTIIAIVTLTLLAESMTWAQSTQPINEYELGEIYEFFDLNPDDPTVFEVGGRAVDGGKYPRHVTGFYRKAPYLFDGQLCVLETRTHSGEIHDSVLVWGDYETELSMSVWTGSTPTSCAIKSLDSMPKSVRVYRPLELGDILRIVLLEHELFRLILDSPNGARYAEWGTYRLSRISPARQDLDLGDFCASFESPKQLDGPTICFEFQDDQINVAKVGGWIS